MIPELPVELIASYRSGTLVPLLGPAALDGVVDAGGKPIPADSESLILALNNGQPMAKKLMYEFPRAAMNIELKRGRSALVRFFDATYRDHAWSASALHERIAELDLPYVIDFNRDTQLQDFWATRPHLLVVGIARLSGDFARYRLFQHDGKAYHAVAEGNLNASLPVLFKPVGAARPESLYVASDADYVDYLTELMGGFGMPAFLKQSRLGKQYLLIGLRLNRDTERMLLSDIAWGAGEPAGWACMPECSTKERRFLERNGFSVLDLAPAQVLNGLSPHHDPLVRTLAGAHP
jgi:hypothetical protein